MIAGPIPGTLEVGQSTMIVAPAPLIAARPVRSIRPVDAIAVRGQRTLHELPLRGHNDVLVHALIVAGRGRSLLVGQCEKWAVRGDGSDLSRIPLRAPLPEKSRILRRQLRRCGERTRLPGKTCHHQHDEDSRSPRHPAYPKSRFHSFVLQLVHEHTPGSAKATLRSLIQSYFFTALFFETGSGLASVLAFIPRITSRFFSRALRSRCSRDLSPLR